MPHARQEVTALLAEVNVGREDAFARLIQLVYPELRRMAGRYLRRERIGHTLQPTALVHEAYLRLVGQDHPDWQARGQFFAVAAQMMRRILVDYANRRSAAKRGGQPVTFDEDRFAQPMSIDPDELLAIDEALKRLAQIDPQQARVVEMRYFAGLSVEETADAMGMSPRTVKREWAMARAWMQAQFSGGAPR